MFKSADVVYFKECWAGTHRKSPGARYKGHAFGMMLGVIPPFGKLPSPQELLRMVGACGFLTFDDVADFIGDEAAQTCLAKYEEKYYAEAKPEVKDAATGRIVGVDGAPLVVTDKVRNMPLLSMAAARGAGRPQVILTANDVKEKIAAMTPEQILAILSNAKTNVTGTLTKEQEEDITRKACAALGVDPEPVLNAKRKESVQGADTGTAAEDQTADEPIFPRRLLQREEESE